MPSQRTAIVLTCANCGTTRLLPAWKAARRRFCSHACASEASRREPIQIRVWDSIEQGTSEQCWPWRASVSRNGYGQIQDRESGRRRLAHQVVLEAKLGRPLSSGSGECALHRCDNRRCCNPAHLYVGTQADNMRDMLRRGRHRFGRLNGERVGTAKLSAAQVAIIRAILAAGPPEGMKSALARLYGVSPTTIGRIADGTSWGHVTSPDP